MLIFCLKVYNLRIADFGPAGRRSGLLKNVPGQDWGCTCMLFTMVIHSHQSHYQSSSSLFQLVIITFMGIVIMGNHSMSLLRIVHSTPWRLSIHRKP